MMLPILLAGFLGFATASLQPPPAEKSAWPCPEPNDIFPCTCSESNLHIDLDCSNVADDYQLQKVFQADFPFHVFRYLIIVKKTTEKRVPITLLDETTFSNISFSNIRISHTKLRDIAPNTFNNSLTRLETLLVTDSFLTTFPFDILIDCPLLTDLRVFKNNITHMSNIRSNSLTYLQVSQNPYLRFEDQAFYNAPSLEYLLLNDIGLPHVAANSFSKQLHMKYLDLSHNRIEVLYTDALALRYSPIEQIKLDGNRIRTVQKGAISGLQQSIALWLQHNLLTNLTQQVWEPIFQSVDNSAESNLIVLDDNPLVCDCNILWLVKRDSYLDSLARGAWCHNSDQAIHEVDVAFLEENCI
ncbi:oplophorus-luciferin 2-monooxygenase non-catalytic subunit-like [Panulirus ornatus]|uniref:oplophorus-luciferin 2-monooxygenase non-catalytic subunit-like n=1 Tax=Panulirus ornatus TaxID=150431 RepID=UPI003A8836E1